jgi:acyl-CoA thioester hydrolase
MTAAGETGPAGEVAAGPWAMQRRHRIRWSECDLYAHVNHAAYLTLCEDLRVAHWRALGGDFRPAQPGPVVATLECRYLRPLRFEDEVLLTLRTASIRRSSLVHEYAIWQPAETSGRPAFTARALLVIVRGDTGAKAPLPAEIRARLLAEGAREES